MSTGVKKILNSNQSLAQKWCVLCWPCPFFPRYPNTNIKKGRQDKCLRIPHTNRKVEFVQKALVRLTLGMDFVYFIYLGLGLLTDTHFDISHPNQIRNNGGRIGQKARVLAAGRAPLSFIVTYIENSQVLVRRELIPRREKGQVMRATQVR